MRLFVVLLAVPAWFVPAPSGWRNYLVGAVCVVSVFVFVDWLSESGKHTSQADEES